MRDGVGIVGIFILAVLLRASHLGTWSFASDELGTFRDIEWTVHPELAPDTADAHLPRMIPLGMRTIELGHRIFGTSELGSRTLIALLGILQVCAAYYLTLALFDRRTAVAVGLLLAVLPEQIFYSQYHRFYIPAAVWVTLSLFAGAIAIDRERPIWMALACLAAFFAILTHTLTGILFVMLFLGLVAAWWFGGAEVPRATVLILCLSGVMAAAFALFVLYPLGKSKAIGYAWSGASPLGGMFAAIMQVGWPICLAAGYGAFALVGRSPAQAAYWTIVTAIWLAASTLLPMAIPFHSAYTFPFCVTAVVLAGIGLSELARPFTAERPMLAIGLYLTAACVQLPALVSYYQDGNRHDHRAASRWLAEHLGPDDRVAAIQQDYLIHYAPPLAGKTQRMPYTFDPRWIDSHRPNPGTWYLLMQCGRDGPNATWRAWLDKHAERLETIGAKRFDYYDFKLEIYRIRLPATVPEETASSVVP